MGRFFVWMVAGAMLMGANGVAVAGAFKLEMGMSKSEIEKALGETLIPKGNGLYSVGGSFLENFRVAVVFIDPVVGLAKYAAVKKVFTDIYGTQIEEDFYWALSKLEKRYGSCDIGDTGGRSCRSENYVVPRSLWSKPYYFMRGLVAKKRILKAHWVFDDGIVDAIELKVTAKRTSHGLVQVTYQSRYFDGIPGIEKPQEEDADQF